MIGLLARWWIRDHKNYKQEQVRSGYGTLCGAVGIVLNLLLFAGKYVAGVLTGSVAITADSFNNLSDAASSVLMLLGFRWAAKQADADHPYGHGRIEYVTGMVISFLIMLMGVELLKTSVDKILHPQPVTFSWLTAGILAASVVIKCYMAVYNRGIGKKIESSAMLATATDSLSDAIATTVVFISTVVSYVTHWPLDGWCGALVALLILYAGFSSVKDTLGELLGKSPDPELIRQIKEVVLSHDAVVGIHDLLLHDYGPGRRMISLHAEVPGDGNIFELHDAIDHIEMEIMERFHCETTIHMDPVEVNNQKVDAAKKKLISCLKNVDETVSIHDFRMVVGPTHTNYIFDLEMPVESKKSESQLRREVESMVAQEFENTFAVFKIDRIRF
ncbi:MAG: cation transporter [Clostridia bacterium]|nr:cation transporter [Clostridia bacterium]